MFAAPSVLILLDTTVQFSKFCFVFFFPGVITDTHCKLDTEQPRGQTTVRVFSERFNLRGEIIPDCGSIPWGKVLEGIK